MKAGGSLSRLADAIVERVPALGQRNFRHYFYGQICSVFGSAIQTVALSWLVYRLTNSPVLLGLTVFLSQAPQLFISPLAGIIIDRLDRKKILIVLQYLFSSQALLITGLVFFELIEIWHILCIAFILGVLNSFDLPSRQSIIFYLLEDRTVLANAVALNAAVVHTGRLVGPPIAGLLLAVLPDSVCFLTNAFCYLGPLIAIYTIDAVIPKSSMTRQGSAFGEVFVFVRESFEVKTALGLIALVNGIASCYIVLMPAFTKDLFGGSSETLGMLLGMGGSGALCSALYLTTQSRSKICIKFILRSCTVACVGLLGFSLAAVFGWIYLAIPMVAMIGCGIAATNISSNVLLQHHSTDSLRGRLISIFGSVRFGSEAFGGMIAGLIAGMVGIAPVTVFYGLLLAAGIFAIYQYTRKMVQ